MASHRLGRSSTLFRSPLSAKISPTASRPSRTLSTTPSQPGAPSPFAGSTAPRHLTGIKDLTSPELIQLVRNASEFKQSVGSTGRLPGSLSSSITGQTVAMLFSKRSTRTRVSTEAAVALLGGHSMFLGKDDIQLGVNESARDTATVISSMTSCIVARVGAHSEITDLAAHSSVPIINALSSDYHPFQTITDLLTIHQQIPGSLSSSSSTSGLEGLKVAWVGDGNNVLIDLVLGCVKLGIDISVSSPTGYGIPQHIRPIIEQAIQSTARPGKFIETTVPEEAIQSADFIVTDTWISMGQEEESKARLQAFSGYQVTNELARRGGANPDWKFLHCLPRHAEEVDDEVFYGPRSLVFPEAQNRLWAAIAALDAFVVKKGNFI